MLNAEESDDWKRNFQNNKEQQLATGLAPEKAEDSFTNALHEVNVSEVKSQFKNAMGAFLYIVEEAFEHIFRSSTHIFELTTRTVVDDNVNHLISLQIRTGVLFTRLLTSTCTITWKPAKPPSQFAGSFSATTNYSPR